VRTSTMNKRILCVAMTTQALFTASHTLHANELSLYGLGHVSADAVDSGEDTSQFIASNSSRLGLKGFYQLNEGFDIIYQYETGVDLTAQGGNDGNGGAESSGQIFTKGRESYVGLRGNFGTILLGHMPALDQWANEFNFFADQVGDLGNLWEASGIPGRLDNVVYYQAPNFEGLNFALTYSPEEGVDRADYLILKSDYTFSDSKLGFAFVHIGQAQPSLENHTAYAITFQTKVDKFILGGGMQAEQNIQGLDGNDRISFNIGASVIIGEKGVLKAQYAISNGEADSTDASQFAIGYDYIFDDNNMVYLAFASTQNDADVNFSVNGKGHGDKVTPLLGNDPYVISLGLIAKFDLNFAL
jgi:predicted porin